MMDIDEKLAAMAQRAVDQTTRSFGRQANHAERRPALTGPHVVASTLDTLFHRVPFRISLLPGDPLLTELSTAAANLEPVALGHPCGLRLKLTYILAPALSPKPSSARRSLAEDRVRYFAPVVGHGGRDYERTVLIGYANGLNHERHLCQVFSN
jgi:hypothetical protein